MTKACMVRGGSSEGWNFNAHSFDKNRPLTMRFAGMACWTYYNVCFMSSCLVPPPQILQKAMCPGTSSKRGGSVEMTADCTASQSHLFSRLHANDVAA